MLNNKLSLSDFKLFRGLINQRSGIFLSEAKQNFLAIRLNYRMEACKLSSFKEYYYYLKYDPKGNEEMQKLINAVSVNETYFFRDKDQLSIFKNHALHGIMNLKRSRGERQIKIWSAACSTGEEPYSIAILVSDVINRTPTHWDVEIIATDISTLALASARRGEYDDYALRETKLNYLNRYFEQAGQGKYQVISDIKKMVSFGHINLTDSSSTRKIIDMDCVFCRNVIIYLDMDSRRRVIENMYRSLNQNDGYLFLGQAENLREIESPLQPLHFDGTVIYRKQPSAKLLEAA